MNIHTKLDWLNALFSIIMRKDKEETKCTVYIYNTLTETHRIMSNREPNRFDLLN